MNETKRQRMSQRDKEWDKETKSRKRWKRLNRRKRREEKEKQANHMISTKTITDFIPIAVDKFLCRLWCYQAALLWLQLFKTHILSILFSHSLTENFLRLSRFAWLCLRTKYSPHSLHRERGGKPEATSLKLQFLETEKDPIPTQKRSWQSLRLGRLFRTAAVQLISMLQPVTNSLVSERRRKNLLGWVPGDSGQKRWPKCSDRKCKQISLPVTQLGQWQVSSARHDFVQGHFLCHSF